MMWHTVNGQRDRRDFLRCSALHSKNSYILIVLAISFSVMSRKAWVVLPFVSAATGSASGRWASEAAASPRKDQRQSIQSSNPPWREEEEQQQRRYIFTMLWTGTLSVSNSNSNANNVPHADAYIFTSRLDLSAPWIASLTSSSCSDAAKASPTAGRSSQCSSSGGRYRHARSFRPRKMRSRSGILHECDLPKGPKVQTKFNTALSKEEH